MKGSSKLRSSKETVELAYRYSSSEDDDDAPSSQGPTRQPFKYREVEEGYTTTSRQLAAPQVKALTPSSFKLLRKNGGTPVRYSASMTPPPCLLRKIRHEESSERQKKEKGSKCDPSWVFTDSEHPLLNSTSSSLSTLTDEHDIKKRNQFMDTTLPAEECTGQRQRFSQISKKDQEHDENCSSLKRKYVPRNNGTPEYAYNDNNGHVRHLSPSFIASPRSSARCFHTLDRTFKEFKRGSKVNNSAELFSESRSESVVAENEIANLRSIIEELKEKVNRMMTPLSNAMKQISNSLEEVNNLRDETLKICEIANKTKINLDKLMEEAEGLVGFLRKIASCQSERICGCSCTHKAKSSLNGSLVDLGQFSSLPIRKRSKSPRFCKNIAVNKSLECIVETPSYISVPQSLAQKPLHRHHRRKSESERSESSELTSSDNDSKSVLQKSKYQKS